MICTRIFYFDCDVLDTVRVKRYMQIFTNYNCAIPPQFVFVFPFRR